MDAYQARLAFHNLCCYLRNHLEDHVSIKLVAFDRFLYGLHVYSAFLLCQHVPTDGNIFTKYAERLTQGAMDAFMFSVEELSLKFPFDAIRDFASFDSNFVGFQRAFFKLLNDEVVPAVLLLRLIDQVRTRKEHIVAFIEERKYGPEAELR